MIDSFNSISGDLASLNSNILDDFLVQSLGDENTLLGIVSQYF